MTKLWDKDGPIELRKKKGLNDISHFSHSLPFLENGYTDINDVIMVDVARGRFENMEATGTRGMKRQLLGFMGGV